MKKFIVNVFATTGIALTGLSCIALFVKAEWLYVLTVFQVLGASAMIYAGISGIQMLDLKSGELKMAMELVWTEGILLVSGSVFGWFASVPVGVLVIMGAAIYAASYVLDMLHMRREAREINTLIRMYNKRASESMR